MNQIYDEILLGPKPIEAVQAFFGLGHEALFTAFSMLGEVWGVLVAIGLSMWVWGRHTAYRVLLAIILATLAKEAMNLLVHVPRPSADSIVVYQHLKTPSFPSGHVMTAVAIWGVLYAERCVPVVFAVAAAVLVSLGRLYLGAHYLGDVLVGVGAGAAMAWIAAKAWDPVHSWFDRRSYGQVLGMGLVAAGAMVANLVMNSDIPHRWSVTGLALGLIAGFVLEAYYGLAATGKGVRTSAGRDHESDRRLKMTAVGLAGLAGCYALSRLIGQTSLMIDLAVLFIAALWTTAGVTFLLGRRRAPQEGNSEGEGNPEA